MKWTKDQAVALQEIDEWRLAPRMSSNNFYTLEGAAGTGKTTIVLEIIKLFRGTKIAVAAPTHTAKEVIGEMTGLPALTVHNLLGLRPDLDLADYNPNNPLYSAQSKEKIQDFGIVFIDEGSMVNKLLDKKIRDKAVQYSTMILYIGDSFQLPPVGEKMSNIFMYPNKSILKEVVRQDHENPNQAILISARNDIEFGTNEIDELYAKPFENVNTYNEHFREQGTILTNDMDRFYDKLIELYSDSEARVNNRFIKTLAYTNSAVEKLNVYIKNRVNPSFDFIGEGDYLLGYKTVMVGSKTVTVQNGSTYYVQHLQIGEIVVNMRLYKCYKVLTSKNDVINILHPDSYAQFHATLQELYDKGEDYRQWRLFYKFKEQLVVLTSFFHDHRTYNNGKPKKLCGKDIDLGYAQTVHKSQGSTYDNVAIVYDNFNICREEDDRKRLVYVAQSRARYLNLIYKK